MITVYVPPLDVLRDMFPESTDSAIINGETIKGKPAYDFQEYWWASVDAKIGTDRLVTFHDITNPDHMGINDTGHCTYRVFVEWLVKLNWQPYGQHKILKRRSGPHVHSHHSDL